MEDGGEQRLLVGEVVVERATGPHACSTHDVFGPGGEIAALDEELTSGVEQRGPCLGRLVSS